MGIFNNLGRKSKMSNSEIDSEVSAKIEDVSFKDLGFKTSETPAEIAAPRERVSAQIREINGLKQDLTKNVRSIAREHAS